METVTLYTYGKGISYDKDAVPHDVFPLHTVVFDISRIENNSGFALVCRDKNKQEVYRLPPNCSLRCSHYRPFYDTQHNHTWCLEDSHVARPSSNTIVLHGQPVTFIPSNIMCDCLVGDNVLSFRAGGVEKRVLSDTDLLKYLTNYMKYFSGRKTSKFCSCGLNSPAPHVQEDLPSLTARILNISQGGRGVPVLDSSPKEDPTPESQ